MAVKLRAVSEGEKVPAKPQSVTSAADEGSRRDLLVALRSRIARSVENPDTPARDLAALSRRLLDIAREIELIDADGDDEVTHAAETPDDAWDASAI